MAKKSKFKRYDSVPEIRFNQTQEMIVTEIPQNSNLNNRQSIMPKLNVDYLTREKIDNLAANTL